MVNTIPDNETIDGLPPDLQRDTIPGPPPGECEAGDDMTWGDDARSDPRPSGTYAAETEVAPVTERQTDPVHVPPLRVPRIGAC